jgi:hypothetical protein
VISFKTCIAVESDSVGRRRHGDEFINVFLIKIKFSLCLTKHYNMKEYVGVDV